VTAVVLSGSLDDGALGSATVERLGGRVVVQDPDEAEYPSMPRSAIAVTERATVVATKALSDEVTRLVTGESSMAPAEVNGPDRELVAEIAGLLAGAPETDTHPRSYSDLTCPDCGGPLYFKDVGELDRAETYDCLVGHRWSPESLFEEQGTTVERALWLAIRSLEERGRLTGKLADAARERGHALSAGQFSEAADEARQSADAIRKVVNSMTAEVATASDGA
jgi:two-component system, chemotaxis family, protein-glutamate methylesterase/glutaminase